MLISIFQVFISMVFIEALFLNDNIYRNNNNMSEHQSPSLSKISTKKCASSISEYIWNNACLKFLVFNPFMVALLILLVIYLIDIAYGKRFENIGSKSVIQHMITAYVLIASGMVINNMLVKHYYRIKYQDKKESINNDFVPINVEPRPSLIATYE